MNSLKATVFVVVDDGKFTDQIRYISSDLSEAQEFVDNDKRSLKIFESNIAFMTDDAGDWKEVNYDAAR